MASSILQSVRGKRDEALDSIGSTVEDQVSQLRAELSSLTELIRGKGAAQGKKARAQAEAGLDELLSSSEDILQELRDAYLRGGAEVRRTVRQHPVATIGAAAAFGVVLALLARR